MIQHVLVAACRHGRFRRGRNTPADGSGAAGREKSLNGKDQGKLAWEASICKMLFFVQSLVAFKVNLSLLDIIVLFGLQANGRRWKLSSQSGKEVGPPPFRPPLATPRTRESRVYPAARWLKGPGIPRWDLRPPVGQGHGLEAMALVKSACVDHGLRDCLSPISKVDPEAVSKRFHSLGGKVHWLLANE